MRNRGKGRERERERWNEKRDEDLYSYIRLPGRRWCAPNTAHTSTRVNQSSLITEIHTATWSPPAVSVDRTSSARNTTGTTGVSSLMGGGARRSRGAARHRCGDVCATMLDHRARTRSPNRNHRMHTHALTYIHTHTHGHGGHNQCLNLGASYAIHAVVLNISSSSSYVPLR